MNAPGRRSFFLWALFIATVLIGSWFFYAHEEQASVLPTPSGETGLPAGWAEHTDEASGVAFDYPVDIDGSYLRSTDWPPSLQVLSQSYSCNPAGAITERAGITEERTVNGLPFCVTRSSEGAAGTTYTMYAYAFPYANDTAVFTFGMRFPQCANYDKPERVACEKEQAAFMPDELMLSIYKTIDLP